MRVRVPFIVQDREPARPGADALVDEVTLELDEFFLNGPVTRRLAVLDFNPRTGVLARGARFVPPAKGDPGRYDVPADVDARHFDQVSVFATVLQTMQLYEEKEVLGRPLRWAFDGPQLLLVPRAGEWANAFYERETRSLQFFSFPSQRTKGRTVHTCLSHDIVAHETGHAILDGIAPDLYNALTPQSLGLHEAVADLTALVMAFRNRKLSRAVLDETRGSIRDSTAFARLAEEFGAETNPGRRGFYLRSLLNDKTLDPADTSVDENGDRNFVRRDEPHALSEVLSGALYSVMVRMHEQAKREYARRRRTSQRSVSGLALYVAAQRFKRMIFRALDYLPPGEVSFADYARAVIAADEASHPQERRERRWICQELVRRHVVPDVGALEVPTDFEHPAVRAIDLDDLVASDWAAYRFANANRGLLRIPRGIPFEVRPRLDVTKLYYRRGRIEPVRELIFKVAWDHVEPNRGGRWFPPERRVTVGTTLAVDWAAKRVRVLLTSDYRSQRRDRDAFLLRLDEAGALQPAESAPSRTAVRIESRDGVMRVRGVARMLHIAAER